MLPLLRFLSFLFTFVGQSKVKLLCCSCCNEESVIATRIVNVVHGATSQALDE